MSTRKKLLVISRYFPPVVGGTPTVLEKLFRFINSEDYIVLHAKPGAMKERIEGKELEYEEIAIDFPDFLRKRRIPPIYLFLIPSIILNLFKIKTRYRIQRCLIIFPDPFFSVAAYIFCRLSKTKYILYFHDIFEEAQAKPTRIIQKILAKIFERGMIRNAQPLITLTSGLKKHYLKKYEKNSVLLPHGIDISKVNSISFKNQKDDNLKVNILYSGTVYDNQYDAIKSFVDALQKSDLNYKLIITSSQSKEYFDSIGLSGKNVEVKFFPNRNQLYELQKKVDILYLPLSFDSKIPLEIKTSVPTKLFDYLLTMKPIFVHAPRDSNLYDFCRENKVGYFCCSKNEKDILSIIRRIKDNNYTINYENRLNLIKRFDIKPITKRFQEIIFNEKPK